MHQGPTLGPDPGDAHVRILVSQLRLNGEAALFLADMNFFAVPSVMSLKRLISLLTKMAIQSRLQGIFLYASETPI
jgi:hypothetical protein